MDSCRTWYWCPTPTRCCSGFPKLSIRLRSRPVLGSLSGHGARDEAQRLAAAAVADLRAQVVTLTETNLLLMEAQEDLSAAATTLNSATQKYRRALVQL